MKPLVLDVSGPHGRPPPDQQDVHPDHQAITIIHMKRPIPLKHFGVNTTEASPHSTTQLSPNIDESHIEDQDDQQDQIKVDKQGHGNATHPLMPNRPIVIYISQQYTAPAVRVLKVLPALQALKNNEIFTIINGNDHESFTMQENKGIASLQFTKKVHRGVYKLDIQCKSRHNTGKQIDSGNLQPFVIKLELHIL